MKTARYLILIFVALLFGGGCGDHESELWDSLPSGVASFISQYYPGCAIEKFTHTDGKYYVAIKDGADIIFDDATRWISINGNGETLPENFLYNELPPALYAYLEDLDETGGVYSATRDAESYELALKASYLRYDIASGTITSPYE